MNDIQKCKIQTQWLTGWQNGQLGLMGGPPIGAWWLGAGQGRNRQDFPRGTGCCACWGATASGRQPARRRQTECALREAACPDEEAPS